MGTGQDRAFDSLTLLKMCQKVSKSHLLQSAIKGTLRFPCLLRPSLHSFYPIRDFGDDLANYFMLNLLGVFSTSRFRLCVNQRNRLFRQHAPNQVLPMCFGMSLTMLEVIRKRFIDQHPNFQFARDRISAALSSGISSTAWRLSNRTCATIRNTVSKVHSGIS